MLQQAYGEDCLSRTQYHEWYQRFKSGRTSIEDDPKPGRLASSSVSNWEKTFTEAFQMLQQAYGEDCLSRTQYHEWYQRFKSGRTSIEDDPKSGRLASNSVSN